MSSKLMQYFSILWFCIKTNTIQRDNLIFKQENVYELLLFLYLRLQTDNKHNLLCIPCHFFLLDLMVYNVAGSKLVMYILQRYARFDH